MKSRSPNAHSDYSASITIEEMARQTCLPISEVKDVLKELEAKNLITVVRHPLTIPRYVINLDVIERLSKQGKSRGKA